MTTPCRDGASPLTPHPRPTRLGLAGFAALALAAPAALHAQDPLGEPLGPGAVAERNGERCVCFDVPEIPRARAMVFGAGRARLGIRLGDAVKVRAGHGVRVEGVVEGSPAARAGVRSGDVITSLDGAPLGDDPVDALMDFVADVEPGDTITVGYDRDGRSVSTRVVTDEARRPSFRFRGDGPGVIVAPRPAGDAAAEFRWRGFGPDDIPGMIELQRFGADGLDLVELNPELGRYFGADQGVLVTHAPEASGLGLRPGDVILAIGGRDVRDPAHARTILRSYRPDETVEIRIMRDRRTTTVRGSRGSPGG